MANLSDEMMSKAVNNGAKAAQASLKAAQEATKETLKASESIIKGICLLLLDGSAFTTENVMNAVKYAAFKKTGDIKYSKNNISMEALQKSGRVKKVDENVVADVMKYFDEQCKRHGVKYSAMKDERNPEKPAYMVFFKGKDSDMILHVLQESYKDYLTAQEEKASGKEQDTAKRDPNQRQRESVKAKLAFFGIGLQLGIENVMQ